MRFDSREHLDAWRTAGQFPRIHDNIFTVAVTELSGGHVLDLGCSYGLLGTRLKRAPSPLSVPVVVGIDADAAVLAAAAAAGIPMILHHARITRETFPYVEEIIRRYSLNACIARRIFPELFGDDFAAGQDFARLLVESGIRELVVEGRVISPSAINPLQSIAEEVEMLSCAFREVRRVGAVSYLVAGQ